MIMEGVKVNVEEIDGAAEHIVTIGELKFPDGDTLQSVMLTVKTPDGLITLHLSPSIAAKLAADLVAKALQITKAEHTRAMEEQEQMLGALRRMMQGDERGMTLDDLLRAVAGEHAPAPGDKSKH